MDGDLKRRHRNKTSRNKKSQRNKAPKMSGKKWALAAQYWQEKLPGGEGLLHLRGNSS